MGSLGFFRASEASMRYIDLLQGSYSLGFFRASIRRIDRPSKALITGNDPHLEMSWMKSPKDSAQVQGFWVLGLGFFWGFKV